MKKILLACLAALPLLAVSANVSASDKGNKVDSAKVKHDVEAAKTAAKKIKEQAKEAAKKKKEPAKEAAEKKKEVDTKVAKKTLEQAKKAAEKKRKDTLEAAKKIAKADKAVKKDKKTSAHSVPEIDAAGAALALGLLGGIAAIRRERRKAAKK